MYVFRGRKPATLGGKKGFKSMPPRVSPRFPFNEHDSQPEVRPSSPVEHLEKEQFGKA